MMVGTWVMAMVGEISLRNIQMIKPAGFGDGLYMQVEVNIKDSVGLGIVQMVRYVTIAEIRNIRGG